MGLADVEVKEARERVRCALQNSGLQVPNNKRITVNLAPADLPKDSGRFDLPIALGILAASGQFPLEALHGWEFAGKSSSPGALRPVRGGLVSSLHGGDQRLVLPLDSAREAALAPRRPGVWCGASCSMWWRICWASPAAKAGSASPRKPPSTAPAAPIWPMRRARCKPNAPWRLPPLAGTACCWWGRRGGKSMLAQRFSSLLPAMTEQERRWRAPPWPAWPAL